MSDPAPQTSSNEPEALRSLFEADLGELSEEEYLTEQEFLDDEAAPARRERTPWWVGASVAVTSIIILALLPGVLMLVFPPFAVYMVDLAGLLVWLSPILLAGNIAALWWGFPRKRPVVTAMSMLGLVHIAVSWAVTVFVNAGEAPIRVLGIPFGGR